MKHFLFGWTNSASIIIPQSSYCLCGMSSNLTRGIYWQFLTTTLFCPCRALTSTWGHWNILSYVDYIGLLFTWTPSVSRPWIIGVNQSHPSSSAKHLDYYKSVKFWGVSKKVSMCVFESVYVQIVGVYLSL